MDFSEITNLIKIRDYIYNSLGNNTIDRKTLAELGGMLLLIDKKLITMLKGSEFKTYIDYNNVNKVTTEVRNLTSGVFQEANAIKSGLRK